MYAELVSRSNYSFLRGASHPEELVSSAAALGLSALAITDDDGLYGLVKAHLEAKQHKVKLVLASRLTLTDAPPIAVYVQNATGYAHLCELISESRLAHPKGHAGLPWERVLQRASGLAMVFLDGEHDPRVAPTLAEAFQGRSFVGVSRHLSADDEARWLAAKNLSRTLGVPLLAHNDVHTHSRERQPLQDVMTAIRLGTTLATAGTLVFPNGERVLKSPDEMLRLFPDAPECVDRTMELVDGCSFSFDELHYTFSEEELPPGMNRRTYLEHLCEEGLRVRYPAGVPEAVRRQLEKELKLITTLKYEGYFLALWDIVRFARGRGILCQGRGSAANSAVCYLLQITSIDPVRMGLLFERFLSMERKEPPDIDVDFEHARREEVLQYVYEKHGRHRAAMVCEHICFRGKLSVKEVGKTLGLSVDQLDRLSKAMDLSDDVGPYQLHQAGLSASDVAVQQTMALARQLSGMPRHLSIHTGGFVITHGPLVSLAPVEAGSMQDRTVVQWEKDDLSALDILKVDLLGLGMLTVVARSFELIETLTGHKRDQNLDFMDVQSPDSVGLPAPALRIAQTLDRDEANSLLYLPRFDERPTPGFELDVPRAAAGIPDGPFFFVSYSRADLPITGALVEVLTEWRVASWWDPRLVIGDDISRTISDVLGHPRCVGVVVVLTEQTYLSEWVTQEVAAARRLGRDIVEVRLRPTGSLPGPRLTHDLTGWAGDMSDGRLEKLRRDLVDLAGWQR